MRVEHEYKRHGVCAYLAAMDQFFGQVHSKISIIAFDALVSQVMRQEPYCSAERVFWIVDGGTIHQGERAAKRLRQQWPTLTLMSLPTHASWLNQIEIYFSILQRKALTPANFQSQHEVETRILDFQEHYQQVARPFEWRFTKNDLARLMLRWKEETTRSLREAA
jgi:hypothetical protein